MMIAGQTGGDSDTVEVEWQFDALDLRPARRWLTSLAARSVLFESLGPVGVVARPAVVQDDRYLDTEDWRIARAGYVLRLRNAKVKQEVTLKALSGSATPAPEPKRRREVSEPFSASTGAWSPEAGPVGGRVTALVGQRPLLQVLEVQTRRRPFVLRVGEEDVAEIALDETAVSIDDQNPMHLLRVEVEVQAPWVQALAPLVEDLRRSAGLAPAALSKFEAGVLARGYVIPSGVELGSTEIHSDDTVGAVADAVIRRLLGALLAHEAGTRLGEDPEDLHDMRVATRRLRAAIGVFSGVLPAQFDSLAPELAWLGKVLGSVRDLDVQMERLEASTGWHGPWAASAAESSPVEDLRGVFAREREEARAGLLEALESPRYERLTTALVALAQQGAGHRTTAGQQRATAVVPDLVERRHRAARKAARRARRSGAPEDFHRLRIRCKRLRYALEFVADLYGEPAVTFIRRLARLQDLLGGLQDCQVSMDRLHSLALGAEPPLSLPSVFFMGALAEEARAMAEHLLTDARTRVKVLKGAEWRDLARVLERLRPTPGAGEQANGPGTSGLQLGRPAAIGAVGLGPDRPSFAPDPPRPLGDPSPPRA